MSSTPPPNVGGERARVYSGRYEFVRQIARGGTAQVYLARDLLLDRPVALKVLFPELSTDPTFVERFRREAQAAANLSHPNIVPVFDWGESERTYYIVMEYVDGEPLSSIIRSQAPLPPARAAGIAADITKALSYAHRHGVVHRDVKPGNVLITKDGQVKVADFGIARAVGADDNVTQTGLVMGTATYFSPEQAQGLGVDGRSDVYALGVVLYEMVTGQPPFTADTPVAIAYKHVSEVPVPPREIEPRVPPPLEAIIMRAMAKQPSERYPTAEDFQADLHRYMEGAPVLAVAGVGLGATQALGLTQGLGATQAMSAGPNPTIAMAPTATSAMAATEIRQSSEVSRPEMPKRRWVGWTAAGVLLAVLLALLVYFGGRSLGYFGAGGYFHMPYMEGRNVNVAAGDLVSRGLRVRELPQYSKKQSGTVISENPPAGKLVRQGQRVRLYYSAGQKKVRVPSLTGERYTKAEHTLTSLGLNYKLVPVTPTSSSQSQGTVTRQSPGPRTKLLPGRTVTLYYVHGAQQVKVPNVAGDTVAQASNALGHDQLSVSGSTYEPSSTVPRGKVIGTNPPAGTKVAAGRGVSLLISAGPPATVPSVVGDTMAVAEQAIRNAGLNPVVQYVNGLPSDNGDVASQNPAGQTQVPKGYNVTIDVVRSTAPTTSVPTSGTSGTSGTSPTGTSGTSGTTHPGH
jgi:beta-lactam-binding protein with PASTA domain/tRNA A-37 threonylcarbamoyl transferase component Bud32